MWLVLSSTMNLALLTKNSIGGLRLSRQLRTPLIFGRRSPIHYSTPLSLKGSYSIVRRYRLIDYIYTAIHQAHLDGSPVLNPIFFKYPSDVKTFEIDSQFFYGDSVLV